MKKIYPVIDSAEALEKALERVRAAQKNLRSIHKVKWTVSLKRRQQPPTVSVYP